MTENITWYVTEIAQMQSTLAVRLEEAAFTEAIEAIEVTAEKYRNTIKATRESIDTAKG